MQEIPDNHAFFLVSIFRAGVSASLHSYPVFLTPNGVLLLPSHWKLGETGVHAVDMTETMGENAKLLL
jgi:hypothetical protein